MRSPAKNVSVDKAGDLKIGRKKCRLYKKDEVVKVAKKYGISTEKKTVKQLCDAIKGRANPMNKRTAKKTTPSRKAAINKKIVTSFMKDMVTKNANIKKLRELNVNNTPPKPKPKPRPKPRSPSPAAVARARANVKAVIRKTRVHKDPDLLRMITRASPRKVMKIARELRRL